MCVLFVCLYVVVDFGEVLFLFFVVDDVFLLLFCGGDC